MNITILTDTNFKRKKNTIKQSNFVLFSNIKYIKLCLIY